MQFQATICQRLLIGSYTVVTAIAAAASPPNTLSEIEQRSGWRLLFDGTTTSGWRTYGQDGVNDGWQVEDGALVRAKGDADDLITIDDFGSFELALEYKIAPGGNSGLIYHATEQYDEPWMSGPEIQILDNASARRGEQLAGWLYDLYPGERDATRAADQWNELRIRITPKQCITYMNNVTCTQYIKGSEDWNARVSESKFASFSEFGKATRGHICLQDHGDRVAFRNIRIREFADDGTVLEPAGDKLPLRPTLAFPQLEWKDWSPISEEGLAEPFRPVLLTHAGDGSNRLFVGNQRGVIYVFDNRPDVMESNVFLDISDQTFYADSQFERGLLGLAFHPRYRENREFYVYYTSRGTQFDTVVSRFRASKSDPNRADPHSEQELLRFQQPFWNHNGGTLAFGPDGYLYIGLGDGGSRDDPFDNGQNIRTLFGSVLRIDVDRKDPGLAYAIPKDNPFVGQRAARAEIWAYGLRNVWRMAFDRQTGLLWAADVGQDLFEEIDILQRGGNYGWNLREGMHSFGARGNGPRQDLIEPVWEYDRMLGASITGGLVYRGRELPQLEGCYAYADFVSGRIWALRYDPDSQRVIANYEIPGTSLAVITFGDDEAGEIYFTVVDAQGKGIYRFEPMTN